MLKNLQNLSIYYFILSTVFVLQNDFANSKTLPFWANKWAQNGYKQAINNVDYILVEKGLRKMHIYSQNQWLKSYDISLGRNPIGPKTCEGDLKTPEGTYTLTRKNAQSRYHKALDISYPNANDRQRAIDRNCQNPGGDICIHGLRNGFGFIGRDHLRKDWTAGRIAITDEEIDELFTAAIVGAVVEIRP